MYWHWESTRQLPVAEIEEAQYDYHAWLFLFIVSVIICLAFGTLFVMGLPKQNRRPE